LENPQTFYISIGEQTAPFSAGVGRRGGITFWSLPGGGGRSFSSKCWVVAGENVIAMGDFNFRPSTEQFALTTQSLESDWVLAGSPLTTGLDPERLIDHIFVSPGVEVISAEYIVSPVSDHPGLLVEITP
jgi:hypothetical protein